MITIFLLKYGIEHHIKTFRCDSHGMPKIFDKLVRLWACPVCNQCFHEHDHEVVENHLDENYEATEIFTFTCQCVDMRNKHDDLTQKHAWLQYKLECGQDDKPPSIADHTAHYLSQRKKMMQSTLNLASTMGRWITMTTGLRANFSIKFTNEKEDLDRGLLLRKIRDLYEEIDTLQYHIENIQASRRRPNARERRRSIAENYPYIHDFLQEREWEKLRSEFANREVRT